MRGIELESEDIIVIGTDGLWDNLFSNEIANILSEAINKFDAQKAATEKMPDNTNRNRKMKADANVHKFILDGNVTHRLIRKAYENSQNRSGVTPWSLYMTDTVDMVYSGGKHDDITCCVIYIH